uniref:YfhO family protein n=1 Tax=Agathobacter sp. TaxID=2021311 RepID=UPI004056EE04
MIGNKGMIKDRIKIRKRIQKEKTGFLQKNRFWNAAAFGIPFMVSVLICAGCGIYPFGENCILHVDMYHQYCPFFMELHEKLTTGGSLFFSWNLGLGSDFLSTFAYYLASPLNWFVAFVPKAFVIEYMTFLTWIKIALGGLFFFWFLRERFSIVGKNGRYHMHTVLPALVFSTAYAFSGFVAAYSWNIMWMDAVALAPLIIMGLEQLVKKNKVAVYYISLSAAILSNFYISLIICIFLVMYFGILFLEQKKGRFEACCRFAWYSLLAGGTGAVLLIPEAIMLGYSASGDGGFPESMEWYYHLKEGLLRLCLTADPYTTGGEHWPNIYCGTFTVLLAVLYILNKKISWKQKVLWGSLTALLFVSFANNYLDFIWHGLRFPNSLPGRQSFLFIFLMLTMGYECWRKRKGNTVLHYMAAFGLCFGFLGHSLTTAEGSAWAEVTDETALILSMIFLACYFLVFLLLRFSKRQMRSGLYGFVFGLAIGEVILSMAVTGFYSLSRSAYLQKTQDYEVLLEMAEMDAHKEAEEGETVFYRVEDTERKTKNDDCLYGYPSTTIFSSLMNIDVSHFYQSVYMEGGKNYYCYNGATPLVSAMLSVKYILSDNADGENALRQIVGSSGGYYLYENKYCLPIGFMMSEEAATAWETSTSAKIDSINALARVLGIGKDMLIPVTLEKQVETERTTITVWEDGIYYGSYLSCSADSLTVSINNQASTRYGKTTHRYLLEFGECKAGDEIVITNTKDCAVDFHVYRLDLDAAEEAFAILNEQTMTLETYTDTSLEGHIEVKQAGRLVFSIPHEEGWTLLVDGKEVETLAFQDTFLSVYLEEGMHEISLSYRTPGFDVGIMISLACAGLFGLSMVVKDGKLGILHICG